MRFLQACCRRPALRRALRRLQAWERWVILIVVLPMRLLGLIGIVSVGFAVSASASEPAAGPDAPWFEPVPDWKPPIPGEHPRLWFRKSDVPALRARMQTPEGRAMLARLRLLLGGGETMPTVFQEMATVNILPPGFSAPAPGAFTFSHGAGFGFLYQLTGDRKYADLARQCVEKVLEGQPDRDPRYAWVNPGTGFRLGAVFQGVALAYDLAYDGWDEAFRKRVVEAIQGQNTPCLQHKRPLTLERMAEANGYPPGSNHYGAYLGGTGMIALAIRGDPGADTPRLDRVLAKVEENLVKALTRGFGDHGWFAEGTHPGRIPANTGIVPLLPALRNAAGRDYLAARPNAEWITLRWLMEVLPSAEGPVIPWRGDYGDDRLYQKEGTSHAGDFALGLGAVAPRCRPAIAWML